MLSGKSGWLLRPYSYSLQPLKKDNSNKTLRRSKKESSKWIKTKGEEFNNFYWQDGYAAFSVNPTQLDTVSNYIINQYEHHRNKTFQDECRSFFKKYEVEYDERYVWD